MLRKIAVLVAIPLLLLGFGFAGRRVMKQGWDELVDYHSRYTKPLTPGQGGEAVANQVVIVLVDGLRLDTSKELETWNKLRARGADLTVRVGQPSLSIPSFTVINTGAYQEVSGVTTNWYDGPIPPLDSIFCQARRGGLTTAMVQEAGGPKLFARCLALPIFPQVPDDPRAADDMIVERSLAALKERPDLIWIHFSGTDWAGHHYGGASSEYRKVAKEIDGRIARILEAVDLASAVVVLVSDHGHIDSGGHGGGERSVIRAPLVLAGKGIIPGSYPQADQVDIAPTVAVLLGLPLPTHSQGPPLFDLLDMSPKAKAEWAVRTARQGRLFYGQYLEEIGAPAYLDDKLGEAEGALARGDYQGAFQRGVDFSEGIRRYAEGARNGRLWRERFQRLPLALLVLVIPAAYLAFYRRKGDLAVPLVGAGAYFLFYNVYFFARGLRWSLSVFNEEWMIPGFLAQRVMEGIAALVIASLVVGALMKGKIVLEAARAANHSSLFVGLGLLLQIDIFYWLYGLKIDWYLPELRLGFKYYLDLLQAYSIGLASLAAPFLAIAAKVVADRVPLGRPKPKDRSQVGCREGSARSKSRPESTPVLISRSGALAAYTR